jgi:hypothetical protein
MGLKKGMTNNPKGRPPGSANKVTQDMRERISSFLSENFDTVQDDFLQLSPKERFLFYTKLLPFCLPTLRSSEHTAKVTDKLEGLSDEQLNTFVSELLTKLDLT